MEGPKENKFQNFDMNRNLSTVFEDPQENARTTGKLEQAGESFSKAKEIN